MKWPRLILAILSSAALTAPIWAAEDADLRSLMVNGEYSAAYVAAEEQQTASAKALAAEILLSEIMLGQAEKNKKQAKRARKLAEAALEIDPSDQNARLQYAIADGFVTRETGDVSAWMKKLPQKTEAIVNAYRQDFPADPRGDALLGAWHLAIARKAGNKNADKWFGASISEGRRLFLSAQSNRPDDIIVGTNYAFSLLALNDEDFPSSEEARRILLKLITLQPQDHLEKVLQSYANEALLRIDNRDAVREYAEMFLDGKTPE